MKNIIVPVLLFLIFAAIYVGIAKINDNDNLFLPVWDVGHYLTISESGYQVYPCTPGIEYPAGKICGNVGWYPFWPLAVKIFRPLFGGSSQWTFIGLAFLFTLLSFVLIYDWVRRSYDSIKAALAVAGLAFSPAGFYLLTGFPYALLLLLFVLYLIAYYREPGRLKSIFLFLLALGISLTYPTGILTVLIPFAALLLRVKDERKKHERLKTWFRQFLYILPFILGPLLLWSYFYFKFDDFFLQLHFQEKYQRTWEIPLIVIYQSLVHYSWYSPENLTLLWYGLAFLLFIPYRTRPEFWIFAAVLFLFSLATGTTMSLYRHYLIILPLYLMIAASARPLWFKVVYILTGLAISLTALFPLFLDNKLI